MTYLPYRHIFPIHILLILRTLRGAWIRNVDWHYGNDHKFGFGPFGLPWMPQTPNSAINSVFQLNFPLAIAGTGSEKER